MPLTDGDAWWMQTPIPEFAPLDRNLVADVCVVGAGISGILCAYELALRGKRVALLESGRLASSVTGFTTAKLTSQHGMRYSRLAREHGNDAAHAYAQGNELALQRMIQLAHDHDVASVEMRDAWLVARDTQLLDKLRIEQRAAQAAGLAATMHEHVPLPESIEAIGGVKMQGQAQFDPRELLSALIARKPNTLDIHEQTNVKQILEHDHHVEIIADNGHAVTAQHVVSATLFPRLAGSELVPSLYCHQGFVCAMSIVGDDPLPDGVFISVDRPMRSLRTIPTDDGRLLLVGGGTYQSDPDGKRGVYHDLIDYAARHFDVDLTRVHAWQTQDYSTSDGLPIIGNAPGKQRTYMIAGFGGWGMTTAQWAASIITELICEGQHPHARFVDPSRGMPDASDEIIAKHTSSGGDTLDVDTQQLKPGQGIVAQRGGRQVAVSKTREGDMHEVSAICTHLRAVVLWDGDQQQWQCPCHGSCFNSQGDAIKGPASEPLTKSQ